MTEKEKTEAKIVKVGVDCTYNDRLFLTSDGKDAPDELINELDKRGIGNQPGKLVFEPVLQIPVVRIEIESLFRWWNATRIFITHNNNEAVNMLMNKLFRKGVTQHSGLLSFEFVPNDTIPNICTCGHNSYAHQRNRYGYSDRGHCRVKGCGCKKYIQRPEEAIK